MWFIVSSDPQVQLGESSMFSLKRWEFSLHCPILNLSIDVDRFLLFKWVISGWSWLVSLGCPSLEALSSALLSSFHFSQISRLYLDISSDAGTGTSSCSFRLWASFAMVSTTSVLGMPLWLGIHCIIISTLILCIATILAIIGSTSVLKGYHNSLLVTGILTSQWIWLYLC